MIFGVSVLHMEVFEWWSINGKFIGLLLSAIPVAAKV
jgi:hypothetical protein